MKLNDKLPNAYKNANSEFNNAVEYLRKIGPNVPEAELLIKTLAAYFAKYEGALGISAPITPAKDNKFQAYSASGIKSKPTRQDSVDILNRIVKERGQ